MNSGHKICLLLSSVFWCVARDVCNCTSNNHHRLVVGFNTGKASNRTDAIQAVDCNVVSSHGDSISAENKSIHSELCQERPLPSSQDVQHTQLNCLSRDIAIDRPVCCHHQKMCHCLCEGIQKRVQATKPRIACVCEELSAQHPCHIAEICFYPQKDNMDVRRDIGDVPLRGADVQYSCDCMLIVSDMDVMSEHLSSQSNKRKTVVYITKNSPKEKGCGLSSFIPSRNNNLSQESFLVLDDFDEFKGKDFYFNENNMSKNSDANSVIKKCRLASGKVTSMLLGDGESKLLKMIQPPSSVESQDTNPVCSSLMFNMFLSLPAMYNKNKTFFRMKGEQNILQRIHLEKSLKEFQVLININNDVVSLKLEHGTKVVPWSLVTCNLTSFWQPGQDYTGGDCSIERCNTEDAFFMTEGNKCQLINAVVVKTYNRQMQLSRTEQIHLSNAVNCFLRAELRLDVLNEYWPLDVGLLAHVVTLVFLVHDVGHPDTQMTRKRMKDIVANLSVIDTPSTVTYSGRDSTNSETCGYTFVLPPDASTQMFWNRYKNCSSYCVTNVVGSVGFKELKEYGNKKSQCSKYFDVNVNAFCGNSAFRFYWSAYVVLKIFVMYSN